MDALGKKLKVDSMEDWYRITRKRFQLYGGGGLLSKYNDSFIKLLKTVYPEYLV